MHADKKIIVNYNSPVRMVDKVYISLRISNEYGFVDDVQVLFNRHGEQPGAEASCCLTFDNDESTEKVSCFTGSFRFETPGYRTFFIKLRTDGVEKEIKLNKATYEAEMAREDEDLAFWNLFVYLPNYNTPEYIKGGIMYQIFVDTFCSIELPEAMKGKVVSWETFPKWQKDEDGIYRNNQCYGGNLRGIIKKAEEGYFNKLNVTVIYLTPIFKSPSQNKYDISDYEKIDEMFGTWEDLDELHRKLNKMGIKLVVDVVFNHSSSENELLKKDPEMYSWVQKYAIPICWWGYRHLVEFNKESENYLRNLANWLKLYAGYMDGIRLDVADSLPDFVLKFIRKNWESYILGEVWKNAITGDFREFLVGDELDGVMNYLFANAIYRYVRWGKYRYFRDVIENVYNLYPHEALAVSPIFLASHDIPRIPNILIGDFMKESTEFENVWDMEKDGYWFNGTEFDTDKFRRWEVEHDHFTDEEWHLIYELQALVVFYQYTLPGLPSIFAGDEAGVTGFKDPTNRKSFPWNNINETVFSIYQKMGAFRHQYREVFAKVDFEFLEVDEKKAIYRVGDLLCIVNNTPKKIMVNEYDLSNPVFTLKEAQTEKHIVLPYNAVVIKF